MPSNLTESPEILDTIAVPDGTDIVDRAVLVEAYQRLANRTRNLMERIGDRTGADEWAYTDENGAAAPKTRTVFVDALSCAHTSAWTPSTAAIALAASAASGVVRCGLAWLPDGAEVTKIRALVHPGGAGTMGLYVQTQAVTLATPSAAAVVAIIDNAPSDGTSTLQWIDSGALSIDVDKAGGDLVSFAVRSQQSGDLFYGYEITFDDPGPRNA